MESNPLFDDSSALHPPSEVLVMLIQDSSSLPESPLSTPPQSPAGQRRRFDDCSPVVSPQQQQQQQAVLPTYSMVRQNSELEGRVSRKSRLRAQARTLFDEKKLEEDDDDDEEEEDVLMPNLSPMPYDMAENVPLDEFAGLGGKAHVCVTEEGFEIGPLLPVHSPAPSFDEDGSHTQSAIDSHSLAPSIDEQARTRKPRKLRGRRVDDVRDVKPTTQRSPLPKTTSAAAAVAAGITGTAREPPAAAPADEIMRHDDTATSPAKSESRNSQQQQPRTPMERLRSRSRSVGRTRIGHLALDLDRRPKTRWSPRAAAAAADTPQKEDGAASVGNESKPDDERSVEPYKSGSGKDPSNAIDLTNAAYSPKKDHHDANHDAGDAMTPKQTSVKSATRGIDPPSAGSKRSSGSASTKRSDARKKNSPKTTSATGKPSSKRSPPEASFTGRRLVQKAIPRSPKRTSVPSLARSRRSNRPTTTTIIEDPGLSSSDETPLTTNAYYNRSQQVKPHRRQDRRSRQQNQLQNMYGKALKQKKVPEQDSVEEEEEAKSPPAPAVEPTDDSVEVTATTESDDPTTMDLPPLVVDQKQIQSIGVKALMTVCDGIGSLFLTKPGDAGAVQRTTYTKLASPDRVNRDETARSVSPPTERSVSPRHRSDSLRRKRLLARAKSAHRAEAQRLFAPSGSEEDQPQPVPKVRDEFPMDEVSEIGVDIVNSLNLARNDSEAEVFESEADGGGHEQGETPASVQQRGLSIDAEPAVETEEKQVREETPELSQQTGGFPVDLEPVVETEEKVISDPDESKVDKSVISVDSLEDTLADLEKVADDEVDKPEADKSSEIEPHTVPSLHESSAPQFLATSDSTRQQQPLTEPDQTNRGYDIAEASTGSIESGWSLARAIKKQAMHGMGKRGMAKRQPKDASSATRTTPKRSEPDGSKDIIDYESAAFPFGTTATAPVAVEVAAPVAAQSVISEPPTLTRLNTSLEESFGDDFAPTKKTLAHTSEHESALFKAELDAESHMSPMSEFLAERVRSTQSRPEENKVFEDAITSHDPTEENKVENEEDRAADHSGEIGAEQTNDVAVTEKHYTEDRPSPMEKDNLNSKLMLNNTLLTEETTPLSNLDELTPGSDLFDGFDVDSNGASPPADVEDLSPENNHALTPTKSVLTDEESTPTDSPAEAETTTDLDKEISDEAFSVPSGPSVAQEGTAASEFLRFADRMRSRVLDSEDAQSGSDKQTKTVTRVAPELGEPADVPLAAVEVDEDTSEVADAANDEIGEHRSVSDNEGAEMSMPDQPVDQEKIITVYNEDNSEEMDAEEFMTQEYCMEDAEVPSAAEVAKDSLIEELPGTVVTESETTATTDPSHVETPVRSSDREGPNIQSVPVLEEVAEGDHVDDIVPLESNETQLIDLDAIEDNQDTPNVVTSPSEGVFVGDDLSDTSSTDDLVKYLDTMVKDLDGMAETRRIQRHETICTDDHSVATAPSFADAIKADQSSTSSPEAGSSAMVVESEDHRVGKGFAGMPFMISEVSNEAGIPKGDVVVSLLNMDGVTSPTWSSRVDEAIWRCRTMRRHCDLEWLELSSKPKHSRRMMKTSLLVDVDEGRVYGGLEELPKIHEAATENLRNDEFDEAVALYEDALMIYDTYGYEIQENESKSQKFKQYQAACLTNVGTVYLLRGEYEEALPHFHRAAETFVESSGTFDSEHASAMTKTAICRFAIGDYATAYSELEEALLLAREEVNSLAGFRELAEILNNLGCLSYLGGKVDRALLYFKRALEIHETVSTRSMYAGSKFACQTVALNMSVTKANIGFLSLVNRDVAQSIVMFEAAARDQELLLRGAHATLISTMEHLVVANLLDGRKVQALQLLQRIFNIQEAALGADCEQCFATKNKIILLKKETPAEDS